MKKATAILVLIMMVFGICAAYAQGLGSSGDNALGGWNMTEATEGTLPEEAKEAFEKALDGFVGSDIIPVALIGKQIVAGTNYCILAAVAPVVPDAEYEWKLVYVYADLQGGAKLMAIEDIYEEEEEKGAVMGGWEAAEETGAAGDEACEEVLAKALEGFVGSDIELIACLGTQIVAGRNYCMLCRVTPVVPDARGRIALVYIYEDLEGGAKITDILNVELGAGDVY